MSDPRGSESGRPIEVDPGTKHARGEHHAPTLAPNVSRLTNSGEGGTAACCGHEHTHSHPHSHTHTHGAQAACGVDREALISARGLTLKRGNRTILDAVDIDLMAGEIVTLIGPNGAGKTTLVRVLLGLEAPDAGKMVKRANLRIGYVPQRFDVDRALPMTVFRFLTLGLSVTRDDVVSVLNDVGAAAVIDQQLARLSGGEGQRVLLARALLRRPNLLVLDEPVRGVDATGEAELYTLIGRLRTERGFGVLLVSHDLHVVMAASDRVLCLNRHVCCSGVPTTVAKHPEYMKIFGAEMARAFAVYEHHHDHAHDLAGRPMPDAGVGTPIVDSVATSEAGTTKKESGA